MDVGFAATPDGLEKIASLMNGRIGNLKLAIECIDDCTYTFKNIKDLKEFENSKNKAIRSVQLDAHSDDRSKRASVVFDAGRATGIRIFMEARHDVVDRMKDEILEIIEGMGPWYDKIAKMFNDLVITFLWYFIVMAFGAYLLIDFNKSPHPNVLYEDEKTLNVWPIVFFFLVMFGGSILLICTWEKIKDKLFPRHVFLIGQGKQRFRTLEKFQWGFVVAFIVSLVASGVIALFT